VKGGLSAAFIFGDKTIGDFSRLVSIELKGKFNFIFLVL